MPQNLPQQILQQIFRFLADGNSQREVARMLGVSQGCISKILRPNRETGRPYQRKRGGLMKVCTPWEDRQLLRMVRMNRFISAPRLRMLMIRRFGRRIQCPAPYNTWHGSLFGPTGYWGYGLASSESRYEPNWACLGSNVSLGAVSIRKTVLPGMAIPMLKIRRPNGRLIFNMEIAIPR